MPLGPESKARFIVINLKEFRSNILNEIRIETLLLFFRLSLNLSTDVNW